MTMMTMMAMMTMVTIMTMVAMMTMMTMMTMMADDDHNDDNKNDDADDDNEDGNEHSLHFSRVFKKTAVWGLTLESYLTHRKELEISLALYLLDVNLMALLPVDFLSVLANHVHDQSGYTKDHSYMHGKANE
jgi:hypothetical protein